MSEELFVHVKWTALVGTAVIVVVFLKDKLHALKIPPLVGYLMLGVAMSLVNIQWPILDEPVRTSFNFLADLGVIALLFQVGMSSHPVALARKLPTAMGVWAGDVLCSGLLGFAAAFYLLHMPLIPSLIVATALTATSVGVSVTPWQEAKALNTSTGQLLLDVAELDDVSAVTLMALLFTLIASSTVAHAPAWNLIGTTGLIFVGKFLLFLGFCYLFSRYVEPRLTHLVLRREPLTERMLAVVGVGLLIAAFAAWLGFSLAVGALFAGLVFSRDPMAIKTEKSFQDIYAFVTPFFFINIGMHVDPHDLVGGVGIGMILLAAAAIGKFLGAGGAARLTSKGTAATLIGISMIPRAEIAMVVMHQGLSIGTWAVPESTFAGMVFVSAVTCFGTPLLLNPLLRRWVSKKR